MVRSHGKTPHPDSTLLPAALTAACLALPSMLLSGCGISILPSSGTPQSGAAMSGRVLGGQQPISGASIVLYQAGANGPGSGALNLLTSPVTSDPNGAFSLTSDYVCPASDTQVYLVARGGNPGLSAPTDNQSSVLMTTLGDCGNLKPSTFITINEVTTVASAWALSQFLAPGASAGSSAGNATGLRNAFLVANNLVDSATGLAGGPTLPRGTAIETRKLYTLADVLATCVNSNGGEACAPLFQAATVAGSQPASTPGNTLDAALNMVRNPANHVRDIFNLTAPSAPFNPQLSQAPNDWTMTLTYSGGGIDGPTGLAFDSGGNIWSANYFGGAVTKLSPNGEAAAPQGFLDASLNESLSITLDPYDNAWITNKETSSKVNRGYGSITEFSSTGQKLSGAGYIAGGIYYPFGVAADPDGSIWVADYGHSEASLLDQNGTSLLDVNPVALQLPLAVVVDGTHNAWFASQNGPVRIAPTGVVNPFPCGGCTPESLAFDPAGNLWITDYQASSLTELDPTGELLQQFNSSTGLASPQNVAADGAGNIWVANFHGDSISGFAASVAGAASATLSPAGGFGPDASLLTPYGVAVDASGNLWASSFSGNALVEFVGLASPVKGPLLGLPVRP